MQFSIKERDGVQIVRLHGQLSGDDQNRMVQAVTNLLTGPGARVIVDLGDVQFMNSTGLGELVHIAAQGNVQEGRVMLANLSVFVEGVLATTRLDKFFEVSPTVEDALARLKA